MYQTVLSHGASKKHQNKSVLLQRSQDSIQNYLSEYGTLGPIL